MLESKINQAIHDCEFRLKIIQVRIDRGYGNKETEQMKENVLLEIEALRALEKSMRIKGILGNDYDLDRLRELEQADKEGRYVVLKFAPGSKVYRVWFNPRDGKFFITEHIMQSKEMCLEAELWSDAYKTREEDEKALEEMENKQ